MTLAMLCGVLVWPATALAGNGHGAAPPGQAKKGNGSGCAHGKQAGGKSSAHTHATGGGKANGHAHSSAGSHVTGHASVHSNGAAKVKAHGHVNGAASTHVTGHATVHSNGAAKVKAHAQGKAQGHAFVNIGVQAGMKPSSATSSNTFAAAASALTKLYGNGRTAGQIAMANGASAGTMLFGPGNSQPHKVACGAHVVDVHALKAHAGACVGGSAQAALAALLRAGVNVHGAHASIAAASANQTKVYGNGMTAGQIATQAGFGAAILFGPGNSRPHKVSCGGHMVDVHALKAGACASTGTTLGVSGQSSPSASVQAAVTAQTHARGKSQAKGAGMAKGAGVLGATASRPSKSAGITGNVLGAAVTGGTLPFTGLPLWLPLAFALGLIVAGFGVRRLGRPRS